MTARESAFVLFDEGKSPSSPEGKKLGLKGQTRYNYFRDWKAGRSPEAKQPSTGESIGSIGKTINQKKEATKRMVEEKAELPE